MSARHLNRRRINCRVHLSVKLGDISLRTGKEVPDRNLTTIFLL